MSSSNLVIDRLEFQELRIPFKMAFRHASAARSETETVWIEAIGADGTIGRGESCPRPYVTGETLASAKAFTSRHEGTLRRDVANLATLEAWVAAHRDDIDANPAAWCALELAILDLIGKWLRKPIEAVLLVPPLTNQEFRFTAVLGDAPPAAFHKMAEQYWRAGFRDFKLKLSRDAEHDREKMAVFNTWPKESMRLRADANNLWESADAAISALQRMGHDFFAIEEPIGKDRHSELPRISQALGCAIILDESFARVEQLTLLGARTSQWIINVRVSKMGGLIRSLEVIKAARGLGVRAIIGAQVGETSLLTRAGLTVAQAADGLLVAQEGAFGTFLLERDVCDPPLMFGAGGVLAASAHPMLSGPGLGL